MRFLSYFVTTIKLDLVQRFRGNAVWFAIFLLASISWLSFPAHGSNYFALVGMANLPGHDVNTSIALFRGSYSSAWISLATGFTSAILASSLGFVLVRGTVARDIDDQLWRLLVATPLSSLEYLFTKWCGHVVLLSLLFLCNAAIGMLVQYVRAENVRIIPGLYLQAYLCFALPAMAVSAMAAIVFDMVTELRKTAGNLLYATLWISFTVEVARFVDFGRASWTWAWLGDLMGYHQILGRNTSRLSDALNGSAQIESINLLIGGFVARNPVIVPFETWQISKAAWLGRLAWVALSVACLAIAAPFMERAAQRTRAPSIAFDRSSGAALGWLSSALKILQGTRLGILVAAELLYVLRTRGAWWWLALVVCWIVSLAAQLAPPGPDVSMLALAVVATWLLLIDVFSRTMLREIETHTAALMLTTVAGERDIVLARAIALLILTWACTLPAILRCAFEAPNISMHIALFGLSAVMLSMCLACITRTARIIEMLAFVLAYLCYDGAAMINVVTVSHESVRAHGILIVVASFLLLPSWKRITSARR